MSVGLNDALSKLYLKLGGNPQDIRENKSITDYIDDLGDVLKSLAELPEIDPNGTIDNGKFLQIKNGKWEKSDKDIYGNLLTKLQTDGNGDYISLTSEQLSKVYMAGTGDTPIKSTMSIGVEYNVSGSGLYFEQDVYRVSYIKVQSGGLFGLKTKVFTCVNRTENSTIIKSFKITGGSVGKYYIKTVEIPDPS